MPFNNFLLKFGGRCQITATLGLSHAEMFIPARKSVQFYIQIRVIFLDVGKGFKRFFLSLIRNTYI